MQSLIKDALKGQFLEPLSDNSEIDMTSDTEAEGPSSSTFSFRGEVSSEDFSEKGKSSQVHPYTLGAKSESSEISAPAGARRPYRQSVFFAWQQSMGFTRNRVLANVQRSIT